MKILARSGSGFGGVSRSETKQPLMWQETLSLEEFFTLPDCPFQRNTEQRLERALKHLSVFHNVHRRIVVAQLVNSEMRWLVDGHTRRLIWMRGLAEDVPDSLTVEADVYIVRNMEELEALYDKFDNPAATERTSERMSGIMNSMGIVFESAMMRDCKFSHSLRFVWNMTHGYSDHNKDASARRNLIAKCAKWAADELVLLDRCNPQRSDFLSAFVAAALLCFLRDGEDAFEFWKRFAANEGIKTHEGSDGVQAARAWLSYVKEKGLQDNRHAIDTIGRLLNAYGMFRRGQMYTKKNGLPEPKSDESLRTFAEQCVRAKASRKRIV